MQGKNYMILSMCPRSHCGISLVEANSTGVYSGYIVGESLLAS